MSFVCPECATPGSLKITHKIELPPDSVWDEIALQIVRCSNCRFQGVAVYTESRRGALDSEVWHHVGYRMEADEIEPLRRAIEQCPAPSNPRCQCPSHLSLSQTHATTGRWQGLSQIEDKTTFPMPLA
jgi:hypothetical protein